MEAEARRKQPVNSGGADPLSRSLFSEAAEMYAKANELYQTDADREFPYIRLKSAGRTVANQVDLYRDFIRHKECDGPRANPANHPGKSWHNYGLAIDVIRGSDEPRLARCLKTAGWEQTYEDEGWHFEAHAAKSWSTIEAKLPKVADLSKRVAQGIVDAVLFDCYLKRGETDFRKLELEVRENTRLLSERRDEVNTKRASNSQRARALQEERQAINKKIVELAALRKQYDTMVFNRCPNGKAFNECDHAEIKRQWLTERQALLDRYNVGVRDVQQRKEALLHNQTALKQSEDELRAMEVALTEFERQAKASKEQLDKTKRQREYWSRKHAEANDLVRTNVPQLQGLVDSVLVE